MSLTLTEIAAKILQVKSLANACLLELDEALIQIARLERNAIRLEALA